MKKFRINGRFVSTQYPAKYVYSIFEKRRIGGTQIQPDEIDSIKLYSYEERQQRFGNTKAELLNGDSVIIPENDDLLQGMHKFHLTPLPAETAKCPIWQWEVDLLQPTNPANRAFYSPRAGGRYEIEREAEAILPNIIVDDVVVELSSFVAKHNISYSYPGIGDIVHDINFTTVLTNEQEQEFHETIYNKYLLKIKLSAWIAKQNLITQKERAIITPYILEEIGKNLSIPEYMAREDLLLAFLLQESLPGGILSTNYSRWARGTGTRIPSIDDQVNVSSVRQVDFSSMEISTLIYCNRDNERVKLIMSRLRDGGYMTCPPMRVQFTDRHGYRRFSKHLDPLSVNSHNAEMPLDDEDREKFLANREVFLVKLTAKGRERANSIIDNRRAFVAMSFHESSFTIYEQGIKKALEDTGFEPRRMDEIQHVNLIPEEIIKEIKNALFVVADFSMIMQGGNLTEAPGGVYYEVGYAQALGKPVLWTCRRGYEQRIHFDIQQRNFILWEDVDSLYEQLKERISKIIALI